MTNYQRLTAKVFGETATATGDNPEIGQFGSALAGTYVGTTDVATIQNLTAWSNGFIDCVTPSNQFPPLPEMTGFGKVLSYHEAYLLQKGIPEWDNATTYYQDDFCRVGHTVYYSLQDGNINHNPTTDTMYWKDFTVGANRELSNLEDAGEDRLHALKGYLENGQSYSDETLHNDVFYYNHSKFDLSKFTVVGSPIITNDGIASGFGSSKGLKLSTFDFSLMSEFKLNFKFKTPASYTLNNDEMIVGMAGHNTAGFMIRWYNSDKKLRATPYLSTSAGTTNTNSVVLSLNTEYYGQFIFDVVNSKTTLGISTDGINYINTITTITNNIPTSWIEPSIGFSGSTSLYFEGSVDLKYFSITVDGYPAFSGNITGIDTIKPADYTVVGTPTINADGIASGFSSSNYIKFDTLPVNNKPFTIKIKANASEFVDNSFLFCTNTSLSVSPKLWLYIPANAHPVLMWDNGNGQTYLGTFPTLSLNTNYLFEFGQRADYSFFLKVINLDTNTVVDEITKADTQFYSSNFANVYLSKADNSYWHGSIDLNSFKIYVDGNLVYQPCLLIPYTESSTGSKVVDVAYRDRVIDVFEQYGSANYYTIDETNQNATLPMGEVYGFIEQKTDTNLSNVTQTAKNTSISWGMPDWSRMVSKSPYTEYTATERGWINAKGHTNQEAVGVKINGNIVAWAYAPGQSDSTSFACLVPVNVGDTYIAYTDRTNGATSTVYIDFIQFIPCKGDI